MVVKQCIYRLGGLNHRYLEGEVRPFILLSSLKYLCRHKGKQDLTLFYGGWGAESPRSKLGFS